MSTLKKSFALISKTVSWIEETFLCLLLTSMIILACTQIFLRFFFSGGFAWADPLLRYMVIWVGLFGASVATKRSKHISIDIISHLVPEKFLSWLHAFINFFAGSVCIALTYAAIIFVRDEAFYGGRGILSIPSWWLNMAYPIAFGIISARFLVLSFKDVGKIILPKSTAGQT